MHAVETNLTALTATWRNDAAQLDELGEEHAAAMLRACAQEADEIGRVVTEPTVARVD
jgi:hypothetical protein